jgi:multiple sugar transport system ATP-binding protein
LGSDTFLHVDAGQRGRILVRAAGESSLAPGSTVWMTPEKNRIHRFDKEGKAIRQ